MRCWRRSRKYPSPLFEAMNSPTTAPTMASVIPILNPPKT